MGLEEINQPAVTLTSQRRLFLIAFYILDDKSFVMRIVRMFFSFEMLTVYLRYSSPVIT